MADEKTATHAHGCAAYAHKAFLPDLCDCVGAQVMDAVLASNPGAQLRDQDDGNLVIYSTEGRALWSSGLDNGALRGLLERRRGTEVRIDG